MAKEKQPDPVSSDESIELERQTQLALRATREALQRLNIPEIPLGEYRATNQRFSRFYEDRGSDIILGIELNPLTSSGMTYCSLGQTVLEILEDLENLLSAPACRDLFELDESEIDEVLSKILVDFTAVYLNQLPIVLFHSFYQAVDEAIVSHLKAVIEPVYMEDWPKLGKSTGFSIVPTNTVGDWVKLFPDVEFHLFKYIGIENRQLTDYRKSIKSKLGIKRNPDRMRNLHLEYDQLRVQFKQIKKEYKEQHQAYSRLNRRFNENEWTELWKSFLNENYPLLHFSQDDIERAPSELAYRHLGTILEYHPDTVETKVRDARTLAKERSRTEKIKVS